MRVNAGLIIYPVLIGYMSLSFFPSNMYQTVKVNGSRLILASALEGYLIYAIVYWTVVQLIELAFGWDINFDSFEMFVVCLSILTVLFIFVSARIGFKAETTLKNQRKGALELGDYLEYLVIDAIIRSDYVEIVLKNREVFVGYPIHKPERKSTDTSIAIVPVRIGYKSEESFETSFRVEMFDKVSKMNLFDHKPSNENGDQDFVVAIPKSEIVYLATHDKTTYNALAVAEKKTKC